MMQRSQGSRASGSDGDEARPANSAASARRNRPRRSPGSAQKLFAPPGSSPARGEGALGSVGASPAAQPSAKAASRALASPCEITRGWPAWRVSLVSEALLQTPCRSGAPSDVRGDVQEAATATAASRAGKLTLRSERREKADSFPFVDEAACRVASPRGDAVFPLPSQCRVPGGAPTAAPGARRSQGLPRHPLDGTSSRVHGVAGWKRRP